MCIAKRQIRASSELAREQIRASSELAREQMRVSSELVRDEIRASLDTCNKQIVAPIRQAWVNNLRDLLAEFLSTASEYNVIGVNDDERRRFRLVAYKVMYMLDPKEKDHAPLMLLIADLIAALESGKITQNQFVDLSVKVQSASTDILRREWDRVKEPISVPGAVSDAQATRSNK